MLSCGVLPYISLCLCLQLFIFLVSIEKELLYKNLVKTLLVCYSIPAYYVRLKLFVCVDFSGGLYEHDTA